MASSSTDPTPSSYIIVGAGVFGVSTALHLITADPSASVTLIDRDAADAPSRVAASWDWNKAVRGDYRDPVYCRLALEALDVWRADALWRPFYHESGIYWISRTGIARDVIDNYTRLGRDASGLAALPVSEARELYGGLFGKADYEGVETVLVNRTSGWADAKGALRAVIEKAVQLGVRYVQAEVEALEFDDEKACVGVRTKGGEVYRAERMVLSTGSYTPKLLELTADSTGNDAFRAGDRIIAAGVTTGLTELDDDTAKEFAQMPVCIEENPPDRGASNGTLPLTEDKLMKWWGQTIFKNTETLPSGRQISVPPASPDYAQWKVSDTLKEDINFANKTTFGDRGKDWKIKDHRICWDAFTPSEDFIISPHSASRGLYIATCGSFHGWKFFPIIGDYVRQMLEGTLEAELLKKWAWDREIPDASKSRWWPRKELDDL
ncbi:FAD dependent oxidoreductase [Whalleya microplaca]|nr:FAD dependent oxidoreductase [Whalleya microplaca]